jgi:hypothetical protein
MEFVEFPKIARLSKECIITEKIDGTNGCIYIGENGEFLVGSRTRWLSLETGDNHGFLQWAMANKEELLKLGPGRHFGEWWGHGIQRGYGLTKGEKRFSLFNIKRWGDDAIRPSCCSVVPVLWRGIFNTQIIDECLDSLKNNGSKASPGFMRPEGIVIFHTAQGFLFKKTIEKDDQPKSIRRLNV